MYKRSWIPVIAGIAVLAVAYFVISTFSATKSTAPKPKQSPAKVTLPKIVDVGAEKCIPCKMMVPVLDQLKKEYKGKLQVEFVDIWKYPNAGKKYGVKLIPTQILYDSKGKEIARHTGFWPKKDIIAEFKKHGIKLDPTNAKAKGK
ncbi:MAG TPA: thioredoxin family protein [Armatimonadota bacterium]|nr:thioredoxin family protein [Armatimonadota bacterium]